MGEITAFKLGTAGFRDEFMPQTIIQSMFFLSHYRPYYKMDVLQ